MKNSGQKINYIVTFFCLLAMISCEDFVDLETPNFQITSENVFADDETAIAAINGIYNQLMNADFSNGWQNSVTVLGGMSADIILPVRTTHTKFEPYWQNEISTIESPDAQANLALWSSAYNIIYLTNSSLEGLSSSSRITESIRNGLMGQALFLRAFTYFYLTNLYGDIPLLLTTDYRTNTVAQRNLASDVWEQIATDLDEAILLLEGTAEYPSGKRTQVNQYVVMALRARVHLYQENWIEAEELSSKIIAQTSNYEIMEDLGQVFLANSREAIWQISPTGREGGRSTFEVSVFVRHAIIPGVLTVGDAILSEDFIESIDADDKRFMTWIGKEMGSGEQVINYYSNKYKARTVALGQVIPEYSMVFRLAEQYLIRAEARAMQGNLSGAMADVNRIRVRAGLDILSDNMPGMDKDFLLDTIMEERKKELFAEWGHRWFDLKRKGITSEVLSPIKPLWQSTDIRYPIPEEERIKNPNLTQNEGY